MEILQPYREQIDQIDRELLVLLRKRYDVIEAVAALKKREGIPAVLPDRVNQVRENAERFAAEMGLDAVFIASLWAQLIDHCCATEAEFLEK